MQFQQQHTPTMLWGANGETFRVVHQQQPHIGQQPPQLVLTVIDQGITLEKGYLAKFYKKSEVIITAVGHIVSGILLIILNILSALRNSNTSWKIAAGFWSSPFVLAAGVFGIISTTSRSRRPIFLTLGLSIISGLCMIAVTAQGMLSMKDLFDSHRTFNWEWYVDFILDLFLIFIGAGDFASEILASFLCYHQLQYPVYLLAQVASLSQQAPQKMLSKGSTRPSARAQAVTNGGQHQNNDEMLQPRHDHAFQPQQLVETVSSEQRNAPTTLWDANLRTYHVVHQQPGQQAAQLILTVVNQGITLDKMFLARFFKVIQVRKMAGNQLTVGTLAIALNVIAALINYNNSWRIAAGFWSSPFVIAAGIFGLISIISPNKRWVHLTLGMSVISCFGMIGVAIQGILSFTSVFGEGDDSIWPFNLGVNVVFLLYAFLEFMVAIWACLLCYSQAHYPVHLLAEHQAARKRGQHQYTVGIIQTVPAQQQQFLVVTPMANAFAAAEPPTYDAKQEKQGIDNIAMSSL